MQKEHSPSQLGDVLDPQDSFTWQYWHPAESHLSKLNTRVVLNWGTAMLKKVGDGALTLKITVTWLNVRCNKLEMEPCLPHCSRGEDSEAVRDLKEGISFDIFVCLSLHIPRNTGV